MGEEWERGGGVSGRQGTEAALAGGWFKSYVHYNSLRLGLENLGENVELSYVRVDLDSLRGADYLWMSILVNGDIWL
eukprot:scaffold21738_cov129-Isochrysis_galbana.AAC.3